MTDYKAQSEKIANALEELLRNTKEGMQEALSSYDFATISSMINAACSVARAYSYRLVLTGIGNPDTIEGTLREIVDMSLEAARDACSRQKDSTAASMIKAAAEMADAYFGTANIHPYIYNCCCETTPRE